MTKANGQRHARLLHGEYDAIALLQALYRISHDESTLLLARLRVGETQTNILRSFTPVDKVPPHFAL